MEILKPQHLSQATRSYDEIDCIIFNLFGYFFKDIMLMLVFISIGFQFNNKITTCMYKRLQHCSMMAAPNFIKQLLQWHIIWVIWVNYYKPAYVSLDQGNCTKSEINSHMSINGDSLSH